MIENLPAKVTSNHIQFAHGTQFVAYNELAELLTEAQWYGRAMSDEEVDSVIKECDRIAHTNSLLAAIEQDVFVVKNKSNFTPLRLLPGSVNLSHRIIENSSCIPVGDFVNYASKLGVKVTVAKSKDGLQKIDTTPACLKRAIKPVQRATAQNTAILDAIKNSGNVATSLPKSKPGKPGVKASIRAELATNLLFTGTVFDKAWERLRSSGEIKDAV